MPTTEAHPNCARKWASHPQDALRRNRTRKQCNPAGGRKCRTHPESDFRCNRSLRRQLYRNSAADSAVQTPWRYLHCCHDRRRAHTRAFPVPGGNNPAGDRCWNLEDKRSHFRGCSALHYRPGQPTGPASRQFRRHWEKATNPSGWPLHPDHPTVRRRQYPEIAGPASTRLAWHHCRRSPRPCRRVGDSD